MSAAGAPPYLSLTDVARQYLRCREAVDEAVREVLVSGQYVLGPTLASFEDAFAAYLGVRHGIGVGTGLDALRLSLAALEVGAGDEVILPANTFAATALAALAVGARPVAADVDPVTALLSLDGAERARTPRSRVVIPVHLYGRACAMEPLQEWARANDLVVLEDACQAHGARAGAAFCGSLGSAGCFSFYPTKNLGAAGDGGFVATNDDALAERVRCLRNYGQKVRYNHEAGGTNSRLDALQAAILRVKLRFLDEWNHDRWRLAEAYRARLAGLERLTLPSPAEPGAHVYHLFVARHPRRDALVSFLAQRGIQAGIHYPVPIHQQPFYASSGGAAASCPIAEALSRQVVSLPLFPGMAMAEVDSVCDAIRSFDLA